MPETKSAETKKAQTKPSPSENVTSRKRQRGDRRDARRIRNADPMHVLMPYILPGRIANEAVSEVKLDLTEALRFIDEKNAASPEHKYTLFHFICAAVAKTIQNRPRMNRYYAGHRYYERFDISLAFVARRAFSEKSDESLLMLTADREDTGGIIDQIHKKITDFVYAVRSEGKTDGTTDQMSWLSKLPRPIFRLVARLLFWMDYHDRLPAFLSDVNPYYCTVFLSNLGSIKMDASYHHLTNFGTTSFFITIGEKHNEPYFRDDGTYELRPTVSLGLTIDERIADGFYFARSIAFLRVLFAHPELLDRPLTEAVPEEYFE